MAGAAARRGVERRGIALIRVSMVGGREDLISPELQTTAIESYAQRKNIRIVDRVEALDESGSQERSKWWRTLESVVSRVEAGEADVVVVWKFSRMARHRKRWALTVDRIEVAGGSLESATEDVDTTTSTGRLTRGMLAELAAWEAEVKGEQWKEVKERRARLGLGTGKPRFGYQIIDKRYVPHPVEGPLLAECYERVVNGEGIRSVALWLNTQGVTTTGGNSWTSQKLGRVLRSGFATGMLRWHDEMLPGQHEALISVDVWERFQALVAAREPREWSPDRKHLFTGLLRCAYCDGKLSAYSRKGDQYRCQRQVTSRDCPGGGVVAWAPKVRAVLSEWLAEQVEGQQEQYEQRVREWRKRPKVNVTPLRRTLAKIETELIELGRKNLAGFYDDQTYLALRADLLDRQRLLNKQIEEAAAAEPSLVDFRPVQDVWADPATTDQQRRHALTLVLSHVTVRKLKLGDGPKYQPVPRWVPE